MPNSFATFALCAWPIVAIRLFATQSLTRAILWTLMGAQLVLPVGAYFKFEMIPQFDKFSIPNLCVLLGCLVLGRRRLRIFNNFGLAELLISGLLVGPIITSLLNGDPVQIGAEVRPGVGLYDALSFAENSFIFMIPFFIGRQYLSKSEDIRDMMFILVIAGLVYSLPLLYEIRMSPTLQAQIYGFSATDFVMTARWGGYRPMVFMGHGLIASFFVMTTAVAAAALWRTRLRSFQFLPPAGLTAYLSAILVLCKSFGALLYGVVLVPLLRWTSPRVHMRVAVVLVSISMLYPALRSFDLFPTHVLVETVAMISEERALSLEFRFVNEDKLLRHAFERPLFGWGRYGRNRVYSEQNGQDASVTDGMWIITIGQFGILGFVAQFGLLALGVFRAASASRHLRGPLQDTIFLSALALIVSANLIELIPNATLLPWTWLLSGALLGRAEALKRLVTDPAQMKLTRIGSPVATRA